MILKVVCKFVKCLKYIYESPVSISDQGFVKTFIALILTWTVSRNVLAWPHDNMTYRNYALVQDMQVEWHEWMTEWMI